MHSSKGGSIGLVRWVNLVCCEIKDKDELDCRSFGEGGRLVSCVSALLPCWLAGVLCFWEDAPTDVCLCKHRDVCVTFERSGRLAALYSLAFPLSLSVPLIASRGMKQVLWAG